MYFPEDHPASCGLQYACHHDLQSLSYLAAAVFDHYHGAIVQICYCLVLIFTLFLEFDLLLKIYL